MNAKWTALVAGIVATVSVPVAALATDETQVMYIPGPVLNAKAGKFQDLTVNNLVLVAPGNLDVGGSLSVGPDLNPNTNEGGHVDVEDMLGIGRFGLPAQLVPFEVSLDSQANIKARSTTLWSLGMGQILVNGDTRFHGLGLVGPQAQSALRGSLEIEESTGQPFYMVLRSYLQVDGQTGVPLVLSAGGIADNQDVLWIDPTVLPSGAVNIGFPPLAGVLNTDTKLYVLSQRDRFTDGVTPVVAKFLNVNATTQETHGVGIGQASLVAVSFDQFNGPRPQHLLLVPAGSDGNVGIGTFAYDLTNMATGPRSKLEIRGQDSTNQHSALNVTNDVLSSLLFVRDDGNVGIGTATPSAKLHMVGNAFVQGNVGIGVAAPAASVDATGGSMRLGSVATGTARTITKFQPTVSNEFSRGGTGSLNLGVHDACYSTGFQFSMGTGSRSCRVIRGAGNIWSMQTQTATCYARCLDWN